jgi:hypothetical protein
MLRKLTRTSIAAMALAGAVVAGSGLPAHAQVKPRIVPGEEYVILYYNNAQHSTNVGEVSFGCYVDDWGTRTSYSTAYSFACI